MVDINSPREEIVAAWLARLRDPNSKQAHGRLRKKDAMCCLGHRCEVVGVKYRAGDGCLPVRVMDAAGLNDDEGAYEAADGNSSLAADNDGWISFTGPKIPRKSLSEIADIIESRPPGLFVDESSPSPSPDQ